MTNRSIRDILCAGLVATMALLAAGEPDFATAQDETSYPGGTWEPGPPRSGFEVETGLRVTMDDAVELEASIAWPTDLKTGERADGPFPVVVEHMPYVRLGAPVEVNTYFAQYGYISAQVRVRGLGRSGGDVQFLSSRDGLDGRNIVDWAAKDVEGSDGRVALIGCSWPGVTAMNDAAFVGPGSPLRAVVGACSGLGNMQRQSWIGAGMPTQSFWSFDARGAALTGNSEAGIHFFQEMTRSVMAGEDPAFGGGEYWSVRAPTEHAVRIIQNDVPVLLYAGWGDVVETGTVRAYLGLQNAAAGRPVFAQMEPDQPVDPRYQLIMGGWRHAQGLDLGIYLQWLETWVRGVDTGIQNTATPMHVYEMGTDRWLNLTGFPQVVDHTQWWLGPGGVLTSHVQKPGKATLAYALPDDENGKLRFETPPLAEGATLSGSMSAIMHAHSSNTNLVMIARLYDVDAAGEATLISRGAVLGSQRELDMVRSWTDAEGTVTWPWPTLSRDAYLTPGEVYRFDIALAPRQWGVRPGHRLRLELTTQTPLDVCPATEMPPVNDTDPCRLTETQEETVPGGVYTVLFGPETPSALNLPQLAFMTFSDVPAGPAPTPWSESFRRMSDPSQGDTIHTIPLDWGIAN